MQDADFCIISDDYKSLISICRAGSISVEDTTDVDELGRIYDECVCCFNDACMLSLDLDEDKLLELREVRDVVQSIKVVIQSVLRVKKEEVRVSHSDSDPVKVAAVIDLLIDF